MKSPFPFKNVQHDQEIFQSRIWFASVFVTLCFIVLIGRYTYLQVFKYGQYNTAADNNRVRLQAIPPARGYIYDRNGILLADNYPVFTAVISRPDVPDIEDTLRRLVPILDLNQDDLDKFRTRAVATRKTELLAVKLNLNESEIARFSENKYAFPGVSIQTKMTRYYPYGPLFAHVLGYVGRISDKELSSLDKNAYAGIDLIGKLGVEKYYENLLRGKPGYQFIEADAHGQVLRHLGQTPATRGNDLYLSLDFGLQTLADQQLAGRRGAVVAMNPKTGEVLAFVSNPSFNPNLFVSGISATDYKNLRDDPDHPLFNRVLQGAFPPGSTVKPIYGLGGIHYGLLDWTTRIYDGGSFHLPGDSHQFRDDVRRGHGIVDLMKGIAQSCDTFFYILAYRTGIDRMHDWMTQFGFGSKTGIDLPGENAGLYPSQEWKRTKRKAKWLPGETISLGIGQGYFLATPLQLVTAISTLANMGNHVKPHILMQTKGSEPYTIINQPDRKIQFNGKPEDWINMREAMVGVMQHGTAAASGRGLAYRMAGKTGTAQVVGIAQGKKFNARLLSHRQLDHAWFVSFAPADNPEIAIAVIVENGGFGASAAAPIARTMTDYYLIKRKKNPIVPNPPPMSAGIMLAGVKPQDIPTGTAETKAGTNTSANTATTVSTPTPQPAQPAATVSAAGSPAVINPVAKPAAGTPSVTPAPAAHAAAPVAATKPTPAVAAKPTAAIPSQPAATPKTGAHP